MRGCPVSGRCFTSNESLQSCLWMRLLQMVHLQDEYALQRDAAVGELLYGLQEARRARAEARDASIAEAQAAAQRQR